MRDFARKLATRIRPSMALPGEAEAQVAAMKNILHTAIARKKNIDPRKLLAWLESGQDFSEVSEAPPPEIPVLLDKIQPQEKDSPIVLTDEEIREVSAVAELRQNIFVSDYSAQRIVAVRKYTEAIQKLVLLVNGYEYPENFNYWKTKPHPRSSAGSLKILTPKLKEIKMQNALKVIEVSGEDVSTEMETEIESTNDSWEPEEEIQEPKTSSPKEPKAIFVSVQEINSASMMVASLERSRLDPHRKEVEVLENNIATMLSKLLEEREKLARKKQVLKLSAKAFSKVTAKLDKLTRGDITFDEFVLKLHS